MRDVPLVVQKNRAFVISLTNDSNKSCDWLPNQFRCHVCQYEEVPSAGDHTSFDATVHVDVSTVEQAKQWIHLLKGSSGVTWTVDVTRPRLGHRVLFKIEEKTFLVEESKQTYVVDMELELCSGPAGQTGAPCKHQAAVAKIYSCLANTLLPTSPEMRAELLKLTSGGKANIFAITVIVRLPIFKLHNEGEMLNFISPTN
ncbi:hypothetical protein KUCAC02_008215 [Scomber scombrus]|uniref:SWIM-type domain-containing protein n=1 Tax=Scomber scombrus TaxID=13677 RepID=A0AAV1N3J6_SCOSC